MSVARTAGLIVTSIAAGAAVTGVWHAVNQARWGQPQLTVTGEFGRLEYPYTLENEIKNLPAWHREKENHCREESRNCNTAFGEALEAIPVDPDKPTDKETARYNKVAQDNLDRTEEHFKKERPAEYSDRFPTLQHPDLWPNGVWYIDVKNVGNIRVSGVKIHTVGGLYRISGLGRSVETGRGAVLNIGDMDPGDLVKITVWTGSLVAIYHKDGFRFSHDKGQGPIDFAKAKAP